MALRLVETPIDRRSQSLALREALCVLLAAGLACDGLRLYESLWRLVIKLGNRVGLTVVPLSELKDEVLHLSSLLF